MIPVRNPIPLGISGVGNFTEGLKDLWNGIPTHIASVKSLAFIFMRILSVYL